MNLGVWKGSLRSVGKEEVSKRLSRISLPSVRFLCANKPPAVMLRSKADFISKHEQKMYNDTWSGIDMSGLDTKRRKNLAHATPMDSSNCSKLRMSIGRECMRSVRENE
uniref:Uncharacterized protein n=1 Tax=Setaria italica TaxID=4555 RepID=K3Y2D5_SETIT